MAHILAADAQVWTEGTKLTIQSLDANLESQVTTQVFAQLSELFDPTPWADNTNTPSLVKSILAMYYVAWLYDRTYSADDNGDGNSYAARLLARADALIAGILSGALAVVGATPVSVNESSVDFFPTDDSSAGSTGWLIPGSFNYLGDGVSSDNSSPDTMADTGAAFSMGKQW